MLKYITRRVLQFIPVFFGVTVLLFILRAPGVLPGDPVRMITGDRAISPVLRAQIVHRNKLDRPLLEQYGYYLQSLAKGDFGQSYQKSRPVLDIFVEKYPNTLRLALVAILIEIVVGVAAGIVSAIKQYSWIDVMVTLSTSVLVAVPVFWLGMLLQVTFGLWFKNMGLPYLPISSMSSDTFPPIAHLILPGITLASVSTAYAARIMRSQLLEVMGADYIRTARAKGLPERSVVWRHAVRNALIPVVTYIGLDLGAMMSGAILTETIFNWDGVGYQIFNAIMSRDWPIVIGGVVIIVFAVMLINLVVDVSYAFLDPRIRYGSATE